MNFNEETVQKVWEKGRAMNDKDSTEWRKDECGAWIRRDLYGSEASEFGWKIENIAPGKSPTLENLRPYQHNNSHGPGRCKVTADREDLPSTASIDQPRNKSAA